MEAWGVYEVLKEAIAGFIEANVEASTLTAILVGVTGSASTAADTLEQLGEVARNSTTGIGEIVDAYVRLRNAGLEPTAETMQQLANIAAMTNTNLGTVANAMAMAAEGSTRSLKELGITAQSAGDQLVVTFRGVPEVIENSAAGITAYIQKLGEMPEALAAQEARLATITGRWDQLKKGAADFAVAINQGDTSLSGIVDKMTVFLQLMTKLQQANKDPVGMFGSFGPLDILPAMAANYLNAEQLIRQQQAAKEVVDQLRDLAQQTGLSDTATEIYNDTLGRIYNNLMLVARGQDALTLSEKEAAASTALANAAADKTIQSLEDRAASLGKTNVQMVQARIATGDLANADDVHQQAALRSAAALDAQTTALKDSAKYKAQLGADQSYLTQLQAEYIGLTQGKVAQELFTAAQREGKAANDDMAKSIDNQIARNIAAKFALQDLDEMLKVYKQDAQGQDEEEQRILGILDSLKKVNDELDPVAAAWDKYITTMNVLDHALENLGPAYDDLIAKLKTLAAAQLEASVANANGAKQVQQVWTEAANDASGTFADIMVHGIDGAGKKVLSETQNLAKQLTDFWLKQHIVIPLQQQLNGTGPGPSGQDIAQAGSFAVGTVGGAAIGGGGQDAALGASLGSLIGSIWPVFGTLIGGLLGGLIGGLFDSTKTPSYQISGSGGYGRGGSTFRDDLGNFGITGQHVTDDMSNQVESKIEQFDDALAALLPPDLVDEVRQRIAAINTSFTGSDPAAVEKAHLDAVVAAVMPQFQKFIDGISGVQNELQAFTSLTKLQSELQSISSTVIQLTGTPLEKLQDSLKTLSTNVSNDQATLASALKTQDPTQILTAEQALKQAIIQRYQTEIQDVQNLLSAEQSLEQASYQLNLSLAQKIASLTGDVTGVVQVAANQIRSLQSQIANDSDFGDALNKVQEFEQSVDNWLTAAIQQVQDQYDPQIQAIEDQKSAIQAQASASSSASSAASSAHQAEINALQKQLSLAQAWLAILNNAKQMIQDLQTGSSNPLGGYSQLDLLNQIINQKFTAISGESGTQQSDDASALLQDLQKRLQLIQSGNLYDRSSPEYLQAYNETLAEIAKVEALANPKASQADTLQKQLDALQAMQSSISGGFSTNTAAIDALNQKEDALKAQEKTQIDQLNQEALGYYTWAQTEAQKLEDERHKEIMDQLNAITGGVDPTQYIAEESTAMANSLESIDQQITDFLNAISGGAYSGNGPLPGHGGGGGGGDGNGGDNGVTPIPKQSPNYTQHVSVSVTVNGTGLGAADIAHAVGTHLQNNIGALANKLKPALKVA